jgi:hypothetical protein
MQEVLYYIYSGRSPQLASMAHDLLAASDRFQLQPLKEMADQVCVCVCVCILFYLIHSLQMMRSQLHKDSACRDLILADMHDAHSLKVECMQFIARNAKSVIEVS